MFLKAKTLLITAGSLVVAACATSAFFITRAVTDLPASNTEGVAQRSNSRGPRNLFLRPEALSVSKRLGNRFKPSSRTASTMLGNLTIGSSTQPVSILRRQTETGEVVELVLGGRGFTWSEREGIRATAGLATNTERLLAERLILDSPDQFVLAQLRGASYFTVARNARPTEAGEDYTGPLWNLVRVDEPQQEESLRPQSTWRIYYINIETGLPDHIEYQLNGEQIKAEIVTWNEQNGEKSPLHMRWTSSGQLIMEYRAVTISHNQ